MYIDTDIATKFYNTNVLKQYLNELYGFTLQERNFGMNKNYVTL